MANKIYVGDVGTAIVVGLGTDLADAMSPELHVQKPDGSFVVWAATVYGSAGLMTSIRYITVAGDLDQPGKYKIQPHITIGGWTGHGETVSLNVYEEFK